MSIAQWLRFSRCARWLAGVVAASLLLSGCGQSVPTVLPEPQVYTQAPPTPLAPAGPIASPSASPTAYEALSIIALAERSYGGGDFFALETTRSAVSYTRTMIAYESDGLVINGFMDVPTGEGPFPVVLLLHGYVDPEGYVLENYTESYAAAFAQAGYVAIHPNYRNYTPSDTGPNEFRVGFAIDVLNLVAIVKAQAGQPGPLERADGAAIFLWGHSMGGGIAQRVIVVGADVRGAVLYGSMSGDERRNYEHIRDVLSDGERGLAELQYPQEAFAVISPMNYYERIAVPVSIHHGAIDEVVPPAWSEELCDRLIELGKEVECFIYPSMPHTFYGQNDELLITRSLDFFARHYP